MNSGPHCHLLENVDYFALAGNLPDEVQAANSYPPFLDHVSSISLVFKDFTGQVDVPSNCPMPVLGGSLSLSSVLKVFGMWFRVRSTHVQLRIEPRG